MSVQITAVFPTKVSGCEACPPGQKDAVFIYTPFVYNSLNHTINGKYGYKRAEI